jgi:hypothetical protein
MIRLMSGRRTAGPDDIVTMGDDWMASSYSPGICGGVAPRAQGDGVCAPLNYV